MMWLPRTRRLDQSEDDPARCQQDDAGRDQGEVEDRQLAVLGRPLALTVAAAAIGSQRTAALVGVLAFDVALDARLGTG